ncbi:hypothetical protein ACFV1B_14890 [Streptomyces sp. NPDC059637]|uniref:hypothetical protein n=1 Tax=Streptomyces sp. NPDC059637 TaxID=3347752 RepID=UPI003675E977
MNPIKKKIRDLLGCPCPNRVPKGVFVEQWISIFTDEFQRTKDADVKYMKNRHPLIDMGWSRSGCVRYLTSLDLAETPKPSCLGCPFHGNSQWRHIRDNSPAELEDVVEFDAAIRKGNASGNRLLGEAFLHRSRVPLGQTPIDHVTASEWAALQQEFTDEDKLERGVAEGCSPWACRGDADALAQDDFGMAT